ncbi:MAG: hypothetical protein KatS3mg050_2413 [Litorilinea sp.]|nr:MAG: hypothetical protein KatS3mg050_2413 [Litorilinea sp.]
MIRKRFVLEANPPYVEVTFVLPNCIWADTIHLVGDFNHWDRTAHPFQRDHDGNWTLTLHLEIGHTYQFRYLSNGEEWHTDNKADGYVNNEHGSANALVITDPDFHPHLE